MPRNDVKTRRSFAHQMEFLQSYDQAPPDGRSVKLVEMPRWMACKFRLHLTQIDYLLWHDVVLRMHFPIADSISKFPESKAIHIDQIDPLGDNPIKMLNLH